MELFALRPDFVLLNYVRKIANEGIAELLTKAGIQFGLLDTEGGVWSDFDSYTELLWSDRRLLHQAAVVCMWGPKLADHLITNGFFAAQQIRLTGCPRFDFYDPQWQPVLRNGSLNAKFSGREDSPRILINTNYYGVNSRFATPEQNVQQMQARGMDRSRIATFLEAEKRAIEATIDLVGNLARDFPTAEIVIRPHPFENGDTYRKSLDHLRNVDVNSDGPVHPQIFRARVVIQRSCTTAIEAGLASVPTLSPQWFPAPAVMPMAESVSVPCESYSQMRLLVESILCGSYQPTFHIQRAIQTVIEDWFFSIDGQSYRRVSDAILHCINIKRAVDDRLCARFLSGLHGNQPWSLTHLANLFRFTFNLSPDWSFRQLRRISTPGWSQTGKMFKLADVQSVTESIHRVIRSRRANVRPVIASLSRERGDYSNHYLGHSVTLICDPA
jgi:surface carbohydrate biosynthesis protein